MKKILLLFFILFFNVIYSYSLGQDTKGLTVSPEKDSVLAEALKLRDLALERLEQTVGSKVKVEFAENGTPTTLSGKFCERTYKHYTNFTLRFLQSFKDLFLLKDPESELTLEEFAMSKEDDVHITFHQSYQGLPVYQTKLSVRFNREGCITLIRGEWVPTPKIKIGQLRITPKNALKILNKELKTAKSMDETSFKLIIFPWEKETYLAWQVNYHDQNSNPWACFIDAINGGFLANLKMWVVLH